MGYKDDCAAAAQAQAEGNQQLEQQRQKELEVQRDLLRQQNEDRLAQQAREDERMDKMEKQHDSDLQAMLNHQKEQRAANQARADQLQRDQEEGIKEAIQTGSDILDKQRQLNQTESQNKTRDHQTLITKKEAQLAETQKNAEEKVLNLKKQKEELQEKLNNDKKEYHENILKAGERHAIEMNQHHEQTAALELQRHENATKHDETIAKIQMFSQTTRIAVTSAAADDVKESVFADSVSNTRAAALEVSRGVGRLQSNAMMLIPNKPAPERVITTLKITYERIVQNKLENLNTAASEIRDQQESKNSQVTECQNIAIQIVTATVTLTESIDEFIGSLDAGDTQYSRNLFKKVQEDNKALQAIAASLPTIIKTQHAIGVLVKSTQAIQLGGNYIQDTQIAGAIMNVPEQ